MKCRRFTDKELTLIDGNLVIAAGVVSIFTSLHQVLALYFASSSRS